MPPSVSVLTETASRIAGPSAVGPSSLRVCLSRRARSQIVYRRSRPSSHDSLQCFFNLMNVAWQGSSGG